jgi:hypothetical protein
MSDRIGNTLPYNKKKTIKNNKPTKKYVKSIIICEN